jgi:hypothetical protein
VLVRTIQERQNAHVDCFPIDNLVCGDGNIVGFVTELGYVIYDGFVTAGRILRDAR